MNSQTNSRESGSLAFTDLKNIAKRKDGLLLVSGLFLRLISFFTKGLINF